MKTMPSVKLSVLVAVLLLSACGPLKDMGEMKDTTKHMDGTTSHMDETTTDMHAMTGNLVGLSKGMSDNTKEMKGMTSEMLGKLDNESNKTDQVVSTSNLLLGLTKHLDSMTAAMKQDEHNIYIDGRQGEAQDRRDKAVDYLIASPSIFDKVAEAAVYVDSFEFQLWKDYSTDTPEKRESLMANGIEQFFRLVHRFYIHKKDYSPLTFRNSNKSLLALAAAMGEINPNQEDLIAMRKRVDNKEVVPMSIERIIELGLSHRPSVNMDRETGDQIPASAQIVLQNHDLAVYLLQLRHNFVMGCVLATMADVDTDHIFQFSEMVNMAKKAAEVVVGGALEIQNHNNAELDLYIKFLGEAIRVRKTLLEMKYPIERSQIIREASQFLKVTANVDKLDGAAPEEKAAKLKRAAIINKELEQLRTLVTPNEEKHFELTDKTPDPDKI